MKQKRAFELIKDIDLRKEDSRIWADLGCGNGLFTNALASILPSESHIYAVDNRPNALSKNLGSRIKFLHLDFENDMMPFQKLDGMLMANSLHYVKDKKSLLNKLKEHLTSNGQFLIVEYEIENSNPWVPFPITYKWLQLLFSEIGFNKSTYLGDRDSIYGKRKMYACTIKA